MEVCVGATGLLCAIMQCSFLFIAHLVMKLLSHFEPQNRLLQAEDMDLFTAVTLVNSASDCIKKLHTENEFSALWDLSASSATATEAVPVAAPVQAREDAQLTRTSVDVQLKRQLDSHRVT